jgi:hypothetical protein
VYNAHHKSGIFWVQSFCQVKSKTKKLVFHGSPLSRQHQGVRAKTS